MKTITEIPAPTSPAHTPGPWYLNPRGWVVQSTGDIVTRLECSNNKEADARLIAASPELIEALEATEAKLTQAARAFYCAGSAKALREAFEGWRTTSESARAAIAKARG